MRYYTIFVTKAYFIFCHNSVTLVLKALKITISPPFFDCRTETQRYTCTIGDKQNTSANSNTQTQENIVIMTLSHAVCLKST